MADTYETQPLVLEFFRNTELYFSAPGGVYKVLALMHSYPFFGPHLLGKQNELAGAFALEEGAEQKLTEILQDIIQEIRQNPPQTIVPLENELGGYARKITEDHIQGLAQEYSDAKTTSVVAIKDLFERQKQSNRAWISHVVDRWVKQSKEREQTVSGQQLTDALTRTLEDNPKEPASNILAITASRPELGNIRGELEKNSGIIGQTIDAIQTQRQRTVTTITSAIVSSPTPAAVAKNINEAIGTIESPIPAKFSGQLQEFIRGANTDARLVSSATIASGLTEEQSNLIKLQDLNVANKFFQTVSETPWQKAMAPLADAFSSVFGKNQIVDEVLYKIFKKEAESALSTGRIGKTLVSPANILTLKQIAAARKPPERVEESQVRRIMKNFTVNMLSAMYRSPIQTTLVSALRISVLTQITAIPQHYYFLVAGLKGTWANVSSWGQRAIRYGGDIAGAELKNLIARRASQGLLSVFAKVAGGTAIGGPVGFLVAAGSFIMDAGFSLFGKVLSALSPERIVSFFAGLGGGEREPWHKDISIVLPLVLVSCLFLPMIFVLFNTTVINSAQVISFPRGQAYSGRGEPHSGEHGVWWGLSDYFQAKIRSTTAGAPVDFCATNKDAPVCKITVCPVGECNWPTLSGKISQGPGGSYSHKNGLNAVDIGGLKLHDPVFTLNRLVGGKVVASLNKYADSSAYPGNPDGGYYGNYIDIQSPEGFVVRFAHLSYNSMLAPGTIIQPGQRIALVGETGSSDSPHVHVEIRGGTGGPSVLDLLPKEAAVVPVGCAGFTSCGGVEFNIGQ